MRPALFSFVSLRSTSWFALALVFVAMSGCAGCTGCVDKPLPTPPQECDPDEQTGCLTDEFCTTQGVCQKYPQCEDDSDCPSPAYHCVRPAQVCELREGFGIECGPEVFCDPGQFCSLGLCRDIDSARQCARRSDCPQGQTCDRNVFLCIPEGPCTLSDTFPELQCGPQEQCDTLSERCYLECQGECSVDTEEQDCGVGSRCNGACQCVQCLSNDDCGPGLECNVRAGRCESEDLCYSDDDCELPLICDPSTALCQIPPPPCEDDLDCNIAEICNRGTGQCELPGGACIDDRLENADTPATAEVLVPEGEEILLVDDLQLCPDDDDVYAVNLTPGDNLWVRIKDTTPQARATLWMLDPDGETSLRFAEAPPYGNGVVEYVAEVEETIYLRVNSLVGPTPYELEVSVNPGVPCTADFFEGETGNNEVATATPSAGVPTDVTLIAALCANDVDHYTVDLAAGEALKATLEFDETRADLDLALFDGATGALITTESGVAQPEVLTYRARVASSVVVRVKGFGNDNGSYGLTLAKLPPFSCGPDAAEPNDDVATANVLPLGGSLSEERTLCAGDVDVIAVPLEDFERLVVRTSFSDAELDVDLSVRDAAGNVLAQAPLSENTRSLVYDALPLLADGGVPGGGQPEPDPVPPVVDAGVDAGAADAGAADAGAVDAGAPDAGAPDAGASDAGVSDGGAADAGVIDSGVTPSPAPTPGSGHQVVYVHVASKFNTQGAYHLDIQRENQSACLPDGAEPNNFADATAPLAPADTASFTLCGFDQDYFRVDGLSGKKLRATASFLHSQGDIDVQILNFDGRDILGVADGIADVEVAEAILPLDDTYYVRVFTLTEDVDARYELTVELTDPDE